MKQFWGAFLIVVFCLGSFIFLAWQSAYNWRVQRAALSACTSIAPYLQIGSYRTAQEIAHASLQIADPDLQPSFAFENGRREAGGQVLAQIDCAVAGRVDRPFSIHLMASSRQYEVRAQRFGLSLGLGLLLALSGMLLVQLSVRAVRAQMNQALEQYVGLGSSRSVWFRFLEKLPALSSTRESVIDLSQRIEAETEKVLNLEVALEHRRAIAKYIHDIRSPIGALQILVQKKRADFSESEASLLTMIVERLKNIPNLVLDVEKAALARERSRDRHLTAEELEIVIKLIADRLILASGTVKFAVETQLNVHAGQLTLSAVELDRLLTNFCENARAAGATEIALRAVAAEDGLRLRIADNGPGGLNENLVASGAAAGKKAGLGLEIVREILSRSGSSFTVSSPPGQGTTIELLLPIRPA